MINIWDFILNLNLGQWCGQGISFSVRGSVWISRGGTNSYIRVGVLPEEDVSSVKFSSKEQSIFKVHVVVPEKKCARGLLFVVFETWCRGRGGDCYSWLCLLSGSEMLPYNLPGYLLAWVELSASINFGIGILCHESLSVDCVIEQPIGDWSHHSTALDQILLSKKDFFQPSILLPHLLRGHGGKGQEASKAPSMQTDSAGVNVGAVLKSQISYCLQHPVSLKNT